MAIKVGIEVGEAVSAGDTTRRMKWRFQGIKSCCWMTSMEMVMQYETGCIYGLDPATKLPRAEHTKSVKDAFAANNGSHIGLHAQQYGLVSNPTLDGATDATVWENALSKGPVIAEGLYGWARPGWGLHVIVIVGVSNQKNLAYFNPNMLAVLPHPMSKLSYMSIARCVERSRSDNLFGGGPFWQYHTHIVGKSK